jgi:hypothetical protein
MRFGFAGIFQFEIGLRPAIQAELRSATGDIIAANTFYEPGQMVVRLHGCEKVVNVFLDPTRADETHSGAVVVDQPITIVDPAADPRLFPLAQETSFLLPTNGTVLLGEMTENTVNVTRDAASQILVLTGGEQRLVNFMVGRPQ